MKTCNTCKETKSFDCFDKKQRRTKYPTKAGYEFQCKDCRLVYQKKRQDRNNELNRAHYAKSEKRRNDIKNNNLRIKFGISIEKYNHMFLSQDGCCKICNKHQQELSKRLAVDHNHSTGEVRGLLCLKCNLAIGYLNEDVQSALNLIQYLNNYTELAAISNVVNLKLKKVG